MALLQKIKEALGFGGGSTSESDPGEATVTVEHESNTAADEAADGTDASATETSAPEPSDASGDTEATDNTEAGDDVEAVDDTEAGDDVDAVDDAEEIEDVVDDSEDGDDGEPADGTAEADTESEDSAAESDEEAVAGTDAEEGTPVDQIKGIGPAYAERLAEIGIHNVEDLADADAAAIAEGTSVGESRAATWIQRANEF